MMNILLASKDIALTAAFYKALGQDLVPEKHGNGPDHFSLTQTQTEIYPPRGQLHHTVVIRIEITEQLEDAMQRVNSVFADAVIYQRITTLKSGRKVIISDPDGRAVEIFQPTSGPTSDMHPR